MNNFDSPNGLRQAAQFGALAALHLWIESRSAQPRARKQPAGWHPILFSLCAVIAASLMMTWLVR